MKELWDILGFIPQLFIYNIVQISLHKSLAKFYLY